jgi:uncharacterized protein with NRDE domain
MCLILFAYKTSPRWPLILASNRDESYARPTQSAGFWKDSSDLLAGRDLDKGGTWLGLTKRGRFAAVTNYREAAAQPNYPKSRGVLVENFLRGRVQSLDYLEQIRSEQHLYAGFGCLLGDLSNLYFYSNRSDEIEGVQAGVHGLSNAFLNTPWPKLEKGKQQLHRLITAESSLSSEVLLEMLADRETFELDQLPQTGIDSHREKILSSKFIAVDERYGTKSSTVIMVHESGDVHFVERSFGPWGHLIGESNFKFAMEN